MNSATALRLGRISNLPTIWSNTLAALLLAGATPTPANLIPAALVTLALSLFYLGGMFLNDWCDRSIDARERPERPIPAGEASAGEVLAAGLGMMGIGLGLVAIAGWQAGTGQQGTLAALALTGAIVLYDLRHKGNRWAPWVMGACRGLVYLTAGYTLVEAPGPLLLPAAALLTAYVAGITYTARQEHLNRLENLWPLLPLLAPAGWALLQLPTAPQPWAAGALLIALLGWIGYALHLLRHPAVGRAVGWLIAGIALVDALFVVLVAPWPWGLAALALLPITLSAQRRIPGT